MHYYIMQMMQEWRGCMNKLTKKIKAKGYTISQFLGTIDRSLRWYRTHEVEGAAKHEFLAKKIEELEGK